MRACRKVLGSQCSGVGWWCQCWQAVVGDDVSSALVCRGRLEAPSVLLCVSAPYCRLLPPLVIGSHLMFSQSSTNFLLLHYCVQLL